MSLHISLGILPGLFDKIQGRLSQNSSLITSKCSITTLALVRFFFSFSACVFDCSTGSPRLSASSAALWLPGSTSSYFTQTSVPAHVGSNAVLTSLKITLPFLYISGSLL